MGAPERPLDARLRRPDRHRRRGVSRRMPSAPPTTSWCSAWPAAWPAGRSPSASTAWTIPRACRSASRPTAGCWRSIPSIAASVHFLQICPRSREEVDEYRKLRAELDRLPAASTAASRSSTGRRCATRRAPAPRTTLAGPLPHRPHRRGDAAARRHEPGRQGIRRRPARRRSGRAGPVAVRRRGARAHRGADRQSVRSRRHRRRHASRPHHARPRAQGAAQRAAREGVPHHRPRLLPALHRGAGQVKASSVPRAAA